MINHKVSIIVPCYNQAHFLNDSLTSVKNQTFKKWECIIVNDGSTDDTELIAKRWCEEDHRFSYIYQDNKGLSTARNIGISKAKEEIILPLDADDKIAPNYLELALDVFKKKPSIKVVYANAEKFGVVNGLWNLANFSLHNLSRNNMIFCSALYKKSDWKFLGGYDQNMIYGWEDWEFWIALLKNGGEVHKLNEICFYYRTSPNSMLQTMDLEKSTKMFEYLSVKHADFFTEHYGSFISLYRRNEKLKTDFQFKLQSEKFVINAFTKKFFGFTIFKKLKVE